MSHEEIRLECLRIAERLYQFAPTDIFELAERLAFFALNGAVLRRSDAAGNDGVCATEGNA